MEPRIFDPNEIKRFSESLERCIYELRQISRESYNIISEITDCNISMPHTEALIAGLPEKEDELIKYFEALREHLEALVECGMEAVYAPPEIMLGQWRD